MKTLAIVTAFPPSKNSLNEYGFHLVNAFAKRDDIEKIYVIADINDETSSELKLDPKIEIHRVWKFNEWRSSGKIKRAVQKLGPEGILFNLQTASFGDKEIPAALGLFAPAMTQMSGIPTGLIMHNLIDAVDLAQTNLAGKKLRQKMVQTAGKWMTKVMLKTGYVSVTLDSFADILRDKYKAPNAFMVPHGSFPTSENHPIPRLSERSARIVTMGKFGTYKKLDRVIAAVRAVNSRRHHSQQVRLVIGGSDHPAVPGYLQTLKECYQDDPNIQFHGYVAEEDVQPFFESGKLAIFDYDSTTGSSGVLHQAAVFGTPPMYPLIGDFVDVTEREGLTGFHYKPFDQTSLEQAIEEALSSDEAAQVMADNNVKASATVTMDTVAAIQLRLLNRLKLGRFMNIRSSDSAAVQVKFSDSIQP